ncbi:hypothetical protein NDU88_001901 [Pleurodeles waltl]|uniref:Secreted protein n=1 Tax=Pleurodeles waltl TaxID=8319 RepID=A0AAV7VBC3_PLEWA|nr:hypothetical protein NDU88_001901 [Pleurodeles waltl]
MRNAAAGVVAVMVIACSSPRPISKFVELVSERELQFMMSTLMWVDGVGRSALGLQRVAAVRLWRWAWRAARCCYNYYSPQAAGGRGAPQSRPGTAQESLVWLLISEKKSRQGPGQLAGPMRDRSG